MTTKSLATSFVLALAFLFPQAIVPNGKTNVTEKDQQAVIQAIEDEIYDWGCQSRMEFVGKKVAPEKYELRVYINPELKEGRGEVIYKFMPIGEIYRSFSISKSGTAYLWDDPWLGFGPERPSYNTLYMDEADLCRFKSNWLKATFTIQLHPGELRIQEAIKGQKKRLGESYRPHDRNCSVNGG
jgi:hypothetical protein